MTDFGNLERLVTSVIDHSFHLHDHVGPGLVEAAYEAFLAASLREAEIFIKTQIAMPAKYKSITIPNAFSVDLLVENILVVEIKSLEAIAPIHSKQVLTYLRMMNLPVGLLINFGSVMFSKGVKRIIDNRHSYRPAQATPITTSPKS